MGGVSLHLAHLLRVVHILKVAAYVKNLHLTKPIIRRKRIELCY